jgi:hypothetical protein
VIKAAGQVMGNPGTDDNWAWIYLRASGNNLDGHRPVTATPTQFSQP